MVSSKILYGLLITSLALLGLVALTAAQDKPVTDICLGCICEAISGCNQTAVCQGGVCGLFRITWAYWADAGKQQLPNEPANSEQAYPNCVNDPYCAANTIQSYMTRFAQDCNGDNVVNCYDYAAIHSLGGYGCKGQLAQPYLQALTTCLNTFQSA